MTRLVTVLRPGGVEAVEATGIERDCDCPSFDPRLLP